MPADRLAYQVLKYRGRDDWRHDDVLRLAHPHSDTAHNALYNWLAATSPSAGARRKRHGVGKDLNGDVVDTPLPTLVDAFTRLRAATDKRQALRVLEDDSQHLVGDDPRSVPQRARRLGAPARGRCADDGVDPPAPAVDQHRADHGRLPGNLIADQLTNPERLKRARVHPVNVLVAQKTYASGKGEKGKLSWTPTRGIVDALDAAFYAAYGTIEPAGKRTLIALDVSGSMDWINCSGLPITPREATAAISLVTQATETDTRTIAFTSSGWSAGGPRSRWGSAAGVAEIRIHPSQRLDVVTRYIKSLSAGGTDVSLPMLWAAANKLEFDTFYILTDNETWAGNMHPHEALQHYRQTMGIDARLVVAAMTATGSSVCDPSDPRQLDISGFDSSCPQLLADFSAGRV